jgi:hypothetical protein
MRGSVFFVRGAGDGVLGGRGDIWEDRRGVVDRGWVAEYWRVRRWDAEWQSDALVIDG